MTQEIPSLPFEIKNGSLVTATGGLDYASPDTRLLYRITLQLDKLLYQREMGWSPGIVEELTEAQAIADTVLNSNQDNSNQDVEPSKDDTVSEAENAIAQVDLNTATKTDLINLPSIGRSTANKIIQNRPYSSMEDAHQKLNDLPWGEIKNLVVVEVSEIESTT